jgi:hypothetical protein
VPDLPLEETGAIRAACERAGLELVLLTTPTTPQARMADIARASQVRCGRARRPSAVAEHGGGSGGAGREEVSKRLGLRVVASGVPRAAQARVEHARVLSRTCIPGRAQLCAPP